MSLCLQPKKCWRFISSRGPGQRVRALNGVHFPYPERAMVLVQRSPQSPHRNSTKSYINPLWNSYPILALWSHIGHHCHSLNWVHIQHIPHQNIQIAAPLHGYGPCTAVYVQISSISRVESMWQCAASFVYKSGGDCHRVSHQNSDRVLTLCIFCGVFW